MNDLSEILPEGSWFKEWMQLFPTCESPRQFILFAGISAFGNALGRRVWLDHDVHQMFPMLNIMLIGPSGVGKSTAAKLGFNMINNLPETLRPQIVTSTTMERLHGDLVHKPHTILFASELANVFSKAKYMEQMVPYVTELLDYGPFIERRLRSEPNPIRVERPAASIIGCSTVEWLQDALPDSAGAGGFLPRFLIVEGSHKHQSVALPSRMLAPREYMELRIRREMAEVGFQALLTQSAGEMKFANYSVDDVYSEWYNTYKPVSGHLAPFAARAGELTLRLSMLMALSRGLQSIEVEDVKAAIVLYESCTKNLQKIVVPMSQEGKLISKVLEAVDNGNDAGSICRTMRNFITSTKTQVLLADLVRDGTLRLEDKWYTRN